MHRSKKSLTIISVIFLILLPFQSRSAPLADRYCKFFGNIIANGYNIPSNFDDYWNQVTPENSGKWGSVESTRDSMRWGSLDRIYNYAKSRGFPFRQHNFVWGQQQPSWITSLSQSEQREEVEEWIRLFGERYPDTDFIDVVNEPTPAHAPPPYKEALGGDGATGWDWVIWCFEKARQYNPNAELHINEYGVLNGWVSMSEYLYIIELLQDRGLIDGIAVQAHFLEDTSASTISYKLDQLAATGLPIYITEYDVDIADDDDQLEIYQEQFPVIWEHPAVSGITLWGYIQGMIWRQDAYLIRYDGTERPALEWLHEYLSCPADLHKDGYVDFADYAEFTLWWLETDCGYCSGADLNCDGNVDWDDLREFCDNWLEGIQ